MVGQGYAPFPESIVDMSFDPEELRSVAYMDDGLGEDAVAEFHANGGNPIELLEDDLSLTYWQVEDPRDWQVFCTNWLLVGLASSPLADHYLTPTQRMEH